MAKSITIKPEEEVARAYADRLILEQLTELQAAIKLSDLADRLKGTGIGLAAIRSLLASNPNRFAYAERRWVPAARMEGRQRPFHESARILVDRFGGPMPMSLVASELAMLRGEGAEHCEARLRNHLAQDRLMFLTQGDAVALSAWAFVASDEDFERALKLNVVAAEDVENAAKTLGKFDWRKPNAAHQALAKLAPIAVKTLGALAYRAVNPDGYRGPVLYDWRAFNAALLGAEDFVYSSDGTMHPQSNTKAWIGTAVKLAERLAPLVEVEDAAPIEVRNEDVDKIVKRVQAADQSLSAITLLEELYEITPSVKTYPDDLANLMTALKVRHEAWWVGGDRFRKPESAPEVIYEIPEPFHFTTTTHLDEGGEPVDFELTDDGLSTSLRKLLQHPLATDVLDEEYLPAPKSRAEQLRLVLKPIHRELGTFPLCQFPTDWLDAEPPIQELIFVDPNGRQLQVWANMEARLLFGLLDWWYEQPIESGAVFSLTGTSKPNVFEFEWLEHPDPVVYISSQRMEELREIASRSIESSSLDILKEVMHHWPKGADFLAILWEMNVVRRVTRRLVASLLSSYHCFYQRSGSPVWHFDSKKVEQGVDKTKRKFIRK